MTDAAAVTQEVELAASTKDAPEILSWDSRARRTITVYIPLAIFVIVLLFPFYWMAITSVKPDFEMYDYKQYNPFWVHSPTLDNIRKLLFETEYPRWLMTTMGIATATHLGRQQVTGLFSPILERGTVVHAGPTALEMPANAMLALMSPPGFGSPPASSASCLLIRSAQFGWPRSSVVTLGSHASTGTRARFSTASSA